jgi:hypothetical protein
VDLVPDPLRLRKSGSAGNRTWTSGSDLGYVSVYPVQCKVLQELRVTPLLGLFRMIFL